MTKKYYRYISYLSQCKTEIYSIMRKRIQNGDPATYELIDSVAEELSEEQLTLASAWLPLGTFQGLDLNTRQQSAAIAIVLDAEYKRELDSQIKNCTPYTGEEEIFTNKALSDTCIGDLHSTEVYQRLPNSNIAKIGNKWVYLDSRIPLQFYDWLEQCFRNKPSHVRINPHGIYDQKPPQQIVECVIVPSSYKWWNKLGRFKGDMNGTRYDLLGNDVSNRSDYYDYNCLNVRRLETIAIRRDQDYLSMMVEELSVHTNAIDPSQKYVIGRMIHLDTTAPMNVDTPLDDVTLKHIDLAINLYTHNDATSRLNQCLADGVRIQDATTRTHLLRVENVPFKTLFKFADSFFRSKTLVSEWLQDEFKEN